MVVQPIGWDEGDDEVQSINRIEQVNGDAKVEENKAANKLEKPIWSNAGAAIQNRFVPDDATVINDQRCKFKAKQKLNNIDSSAVLLLGTIYELADIDNMVDKLASQFLKLLVSGFTKEAITEFKNVPKELRQQLLELIAQKFSLDQQNSESLLKFFAAVNFKTDDIQISAKQRMAELLVGVTDKIGKVAAAFFKPAKLFNKSVKYLYREGQTDLAKQLQEIDLLQVNLAKQCKLNIAEVAKGNISLMDYGVILSDLAIITDSKVDEATNDLAKIPAESKVLPAGVKLALNKAKDSIYSQIKSEVRSIYSSSEGKAVVKLSAPAYTLVNDSANEVESTPEVPLASFFFDKEFADICAPTDFSFLEGSYALSNKQSLKNLDVSVNYIYSTIAKDRLEREKNKELLLVEVRQLEKFLDEYKEYAKEFSKEIESKSQRYHVSRLKIMLNMYKRVVSGIEHEASLMPDTNGSKANLAILKIMLESEQGRFYAASLVEYLKS